LAVHRAAPAGRTRLAAAARRPGDGYVLLVDAIVRSGHSAEATNIGTTRGHFMAGGMARPIAEAANCDRFRGQFRTTPQGRSPPTECRDSSGAIAASVQGSPAMPRFRDRRDTSAGADGPPSRPPPSSGAEARAEATTLPRATDLFVWFEDNRQARGSAMRGAAGFPECLLPIGKDVRVLERRYADGHVHLLAAARIRCDQRQAECVATIYTSALALGTMAWIGTGEQYRRAWTQMYPRTVRRVGPQPRTPAS
jgi:hypothetical protein